jgi:hypothetical protein
VSTKPAGLNVCDPPTIPLSVATLKPASANNNLIVGVPELNDFAK